MNPNLSTAIHPYKTQPSRIMKHPVFSRILAFVLACSAPAYAGPGHEHPGRTQSAKIAGPNKGRVLADLNPHAEFFVTADRKVRLTFVDDAGKPVPVPAGLTATLITGERAAPTTLSFAADGATLLSTAALPEGGNLPGILRVKPTAEAALVTIRFQINLAGCGECSRSEYACVCEGH